MRGDDRRERAQRAVARVNPDDIDKMSTALIDVGVSAVKRNPIKTKIRMPRIGKHGAEFRSGRNNPYWKRFD